MGYLESHFPTAVIITARDAAKTVKRAVASALAQRCAREVFVVDDGSKDDTSAVVASADDGTGRLKIIRLEVNQGPSCGRNIAIRASRAPFICILDADDYLSPDRLDRLFGLGGEGWDLLADDIFLVDPSRGDEVFDCLLAEDFLRPCDLTLSSFSLGNLARASRFRRELGFLKPVVRRSFLETHGLCYDERLRFGEDFLLYAQCLLNGAVFRVVDGCGYNAVESRHSLSSVHGTREIAMLCEALAEFEHAARNSGQSSATLSEYVRGQKNNLALRRALDAKRADGLPGLLNVCADCPSSIFYIFLEVLRAKSGLFKRSRARAPVRQSTLAGSTSRS